MKWKIEEEKRGATVTGLIASTITPDGFSFDLRWPVSQRDMLEAMVTACNVHNQLVAAIESAAQVAEAYDRGDRVDLVKLAGDMRSTLADAGIAAGESVHDQLVKALKLVQEHCADEIAGLIVGYTPDARTLDVIVDDALKAAGAA